MSFKLIHQVIWVVALALWAWRNGGRVERWCMATMIGAIVLDQIYHLAITKTVELNAVDLWHFALDGMMLAAFVVIALWANRIYPMILAALQIIATSAHIARNAFEQLTPFAYFIMISAPFYLQLLVITLGMAAHVRRERRYGAYPAWRS